MVLLNKGSRKRCNSMFTDVCAKPYCQCWHHRGSTSWKQPNSCSCGEDNDVSEWRWEEGEANIPSWVELSENKKQVTFHPFYSSGTAVVRGDTPMQRNYHYYWEVKMLTETYGTDIMVGLGTNKVDMTNTRYNFTSLLGQDAESYGLSYRGAVRHGIVLHNTPGFCRGSIIGVRVDMWAGTLEFYLNREPQGVCFTDLRQHETLYPMACSTAAQSSMRLTYSGSWRASLLVSAARSLARAARARLPPGLRYAEREQFWLTLPTDGGRVHEEESLKGIDMEEEPDSPDVALYSGMKRRHWQIAVAVRDA